MIYVYRQEIDVTMLSKLKKIDREAAALTSTYQVHM